MVLAGFLSSITSAQNNPNQLLSHEDSLALPTAKTDWIDPITATPVNSHYALYPTNQRGEGTQGSFMIYLPDGYGQGTARYPVIYYLHGGTGNNVKADG